MSGLVISALLGMAQSQPAAKPRADLGSRAAQETMDSLIRSIDERDVGSSVVRAEVARAQLLGMFSSSDIEAAQAKEIADYQAAMLPILTGLESVAPAAGKPGRGYFLANLTDSAWLAGQFEKAKLYAEESIAIGPSLTGLDDRPKPMYWGYHYLGLLALQANDLAEAKLDLIRSGKAAGGPILSVTGPNMMLAKLLLERGETEVVLDYIGACSSWWSPADGRLALWRSVIRGGEIPDFGRALKVHP